MMNQNGSCGCNRCGTQGHAERINVGGCGMNRRQCGCQNMGCPRPCPHPCRPNVCPPRPCERRCEERAREMYYNAVERAREEFRCNMKKCHRQNECGCNNWNDFNEAEEHEDCGCNR